MCAQRAFSIEFYETRQGEKPVLRWIKEDLSGRQLGGGLFEFRLRLRASGGVESAVLRVFLDITIPWGMDEAAVLTAARLKAQHRLSLGDAMIAALAIRSGAVLVHKDPEHESLVGIVPPEPLPHKK